MKLLYPRCSSQGFVQNVKWGTLKKGTHPEIIFWKKHSK